MNKKQQFQHYLSEAIEAINKFEFEKAKQIVLHAMEVDTDAPESHNLLGILAEYEADRKLAAKHYLASIALDPTYLPAQNNLARVTSSNGFVTKARDFGEHEIEEEKVYDVEFDSHHIGHIKKKGQGRRV